MSRACLALPRRVADRPPGRRVADQRPHTGVRTSFDEDQRLIEERLRVGHQIAGRCDGRMPFVGPMTRLRPLATVAVSRWSMLAVITILAILIALVLLAVQAAREAARRAGEQPSALRRRVANYHDVNGAPPGVRIPWRASARSPASCRIWSPDPALQRGQFRPPSAAGRERHDRRGRDRRTDVPERHRFELRPDRQRHGPTSRPGPGRQDFSSYGGSAGIESAGPLRGRRPVLSAIPISTTADSITARSGWTEISDGTSTTLFAEQVDGVFDQQQ